MEARASVPDRQINEYKVECVCVCVCVCARRCYCTLSVSKHVCVCVFVGVCVGVWQCVCVTLAGEAVNMEVCVFDAHHLPTTHLPAALTHDGRVSSTGERRAAVVVASIQTRLVLN